MTDETGYFDEDLFASNRDTSREAFLIILKNGLRRGLRLKVITVLANCDEAMTAHEVAKDVNGHQIDSIRPRFAELERMGVIEPAGERKCSVTDFNCIVWRMTGNLPGDPGIPGESNKVKALRKRIKELEDMVEMYHRENTILMKKL